MSERYAPSIKVSHAQKFIEVEALRQQGREDLAWAKFCEYGVDMANLGGAMNSQLPKFGAIPVAASSQQISHTPLDTTFPDKAMATAFQASVDGLGSASVSGNAAGLWGAVFNSPPERISTADMSYYGYDSFMGATIRTGQWLVVYSKATQTLQGRVDVRIP